MTAVVQPPVASLPQHLRTAWALTWHELPRVLAACALWTSSAGPLAIAAATGAPWWITGIAGVPVALLSTGLTRFAERIRRGEGARIRDLFRVDAVLALVLTGAAILSIVALDSSAVVVGYALAALLIVIAPFAIGYGAVRGRGGLSALRGGAILAAYQPAVAVTLISFAVLGCFAIAATAGVLALVMPGLLAVFTTTLIAAQLAAIDAGAVSR